MSFIDVIIPTFNSPELALPCVKSILANLDASDYCHIYLINNGAAEHAKYFPSDHRLTIVNQEKNLGWEGGLLAGIALSKSPYVVFMNDDVLVPQCSKNWLQDLVRHFSDPAVAAVGPSSNFVMGAQNIFIDMPPIVAAHLLIGFCMMVRRSDLDAAGGVDAALPGGDDFDLSLRLRDLGKMLVVDRNVFIYHHGQKTGRKVHGSDWDSIGHQERVKFGLVRKHGLPKYLSLFSGPAYQLKGAA